MAEIVELRFFKWAPDGPFICEEQNDNSGRYVRESDYAALLERHRRLVEVINNSVFPALEDPKSYSLDMVIRLLESALAEEVDDGAKQNGG
jgi:hypothetical protein